MHIVQAERMEELHGRRQERGKYHRYQRALGQMRIPVTLTTQTGDLLTTETGEIYK